MEIKIIHREFERKGRGFSLEELKEAKLSYQEARKRGISVDRRRKTKHSDNVKALKSYLK